MGTIRLLWLGAALRAGGLRVGPRRLQAARRAIRTVDPGDRAASYHALRDVLCPVAEDAAVFDAAFVEVFAGVSPRSSA